MDAAIAANIVLCVVEPMSCGLGGDLFALYREAKPSRITGINASGWSPRGFHSRRPLAAAGVKGVPQYGIHSTTVPGCVEGWAKLHGQASAAVALGGLVSRPPFTTPTTASP